MKEDVNSIEQLRSIVAKDSRDDTITVCVIGRLPWKRFTLWLFRVEFGFCFEHEETHQVSLDVLGYTEEEMKEWLISKTFLRDQEESERYTLKYGTRG